MKKSPKFSRQSGIPQNAGKTEGEEEARFWDTHSPLDYSGEFMDVQKPFKFAPDFLEKAAERRRKRQRSFA